MVEKVLKLSAVASVFLAIGITVALVYLPGLHDYEEAKRAERSAQIAMMDELESMSGLQILNYNNETAQSLAEDVNFPQQLRFMIPEEIDVNQVRVETDYVTQTISVILPGADENYLYLYPMVGKSDHIDELTYASNENGGTIEIKTDFVYEPETTFADGYLYLDFASPQDIYDKVIVIDAGHGGSAPGAVVNGWNEKEIDLAIVLKLKELIEESEGLNWGVYYTRTDDSNPSFENRIGLANKADADLFISIHSNTTKGRRSASVSGTCVLYDETKSEEGLSSKHLAEICASEVTAVTESDNRGTVEGSDIYVIRNAAVPAALIEVGFMTNREELSKLTSEEYQTQIAQGVFNAITRAIQEGY